MQFPESREGKNQIQPKETFAVLKKKGEKKERKELRNS